MVDAIIYGRKPPAALLTGADSPAGKRRDFCLLLYAPCPASRPGRATAACKEFALLDLLARIRRLYTDRSRLSRELILFGVAMLTGLILVPLGIWAVGNRMLGPYIHGTNTHAGPLALLGDFFVGLGRGEVSYWVVALGPLGFVLFVQIAWALLRPQSQAAGRRQPAAPSQR
jgi:hypothetical protein